MYFEEFTTRNGKFEIHNNNNNLRKELAMATLKKRRDTWYARVRVWNNDTHKQKEIQIPLKTSSKVTAMIRLSEVNKAESVIKDGTITNYKKYFMWLNDGKSEVVRFTISEAIDEWMKRRQKMGIRPKTLELNMNGLIHFSNAVGETRSLESVTTKVIDRFVDYLNSKGLSDTSINMHLRTVKSILRYYWKRERLDKIPIIEQIKIDERNPIYITDDEFQSIIELDLLDEYYKRVFYFYRETGFRLQEPFISNLDGKWLDIPNLSKGKKPRSIELDKSLVQIYMELMDWYRNCGLVEESKGRHISKMFKKSLRSIGADEKKHFHSLRHTFAVRRILQNIPIYKIQRLMGHSSVTTTEVYINMDLKRVKQDFPTIVSSYPESPKSLIRDTDFRDTKEIKTPFLVGEMVY